MPRTATINRETRETEISLTLNIDGSGNRDVSTGIGFLDHMLISFAVHGNFDLTLKCDGDLNVDSHHTAEDVGIVLGSAVKAALGEKPTIARYGSARIPMDEALGYCDLDICARPFLVFKAEFSGGKAGELDTCLIEEFMRAFAFNSGITLHIGADYGDNDHHKIESMFKALAYALKKAVEVKGGDVISAKGVL
ncbi:MAG: imidazoleglycerol-phosphate dehydratase HisB [Oscillospiraceae bacterium]|jgi:imidazoleglycerol-phosphate dehydratase|nr:imidazoleglycerol-phosphate dehydratase HisB [Oscillospiraceae bacterium]